ncbi:hypothetical protein V7S43_005077 [Phytophthora oleae]|uniref:Ankyrin repeat protein n=1 Tax=Phytophthora oleae TaxID=2107226 RepID=A0ABD3FTC7_9STRA
MDRAAARGRLDICRILQTTITEGCSAAAFTGASKYGDVETLHWLIYHYPGLYDPEQCLIVAVASGQVDVTRYLNDRMGEYYKMPYLAVAAANGYARVLDALRPWTDDPDFLLGPLHQAIINGHEEAYSLLIETVGRDDAQALNDLALNVAAMYGQAGSVKLLLRKGAVSADNVATYYAAHGGHLDVIKVLLEECELTPSVISHALLAAAAEDRNAVVECLLRNFAEPEEQVAESAQTRKSCIGSAFSAAVRRGSTEMAKTLLGRCPTEILGRELQEAGTTGKLEVAKMLLSECERRHLEDCTYRQNVVAVVQKAAQCGDLEMAKLLVDKCLPPTAGVALMSAVANKDLDMVELFAPINGVYPEGDPYKLGSLVHTVRDDQVELVKILVQYCDKSTIESAVAMIPPTTSVAAFNFLLEKCNSEARKRIFCNLAAKGSVKLAEHLLDRMDTMSLRWALMSAALNGHPDTVKMLLSKADTVSVDCALEAAAIVGALDIVELL